MRFDHIVADPAWAYANRLSGKGRTRFGSGASGKYTTESTADMMVFEVGALAADKCMLWLWATGPFLPDALELMTAWGFQYTTIAFVWIKTAKPKPRARMLQELYSLGLGAFMQSYTRRMPGHYTASNAELVLLGWRGGPLLPEVKLLPQLIYAAPTEHSAKPPDVHEYIETAYSGQRYCELFARRERPGWVMLGNEIDGRDLRESIPATVAMEDT